MRKIKINAKAIKLELNKEGISYLDLVEIFGKKISHWKHVFNNGGYLTDTELAGIARILNCELKHIIDPDFIIKENIPLEIDLLVRNLYKHRKGNIQPVYESIMRNFQKTGKLDCFIGEANRLLDVLFSNDELCVDPRPGLLMIVDEFQNERIFSGSRAELKEQTISQIFQVMDDSINRNSALQAIAIFLYVLVLFDMIFLQESIATVTQFSIDRFAGKAKQYSHLTQKMEILRDTLIYALTVNDLKSKAVMIDEATAEILSGVHLMLLACYKAGQHVNSDYFSSEYVDRTELDAIITRLTRTIRNLGIEVNEPFIGLSGTRFFRHLCLIRTTFQSQKPIKMKLSNSAAFCFGFINGKNSS